MKQIYVLLLLAFMSFGFLSCGNGKNKKVSKEIICHNNSISSLQKKFSFGTVSKKERDTVNYHFTIENTSDSELTIDKIDISCGCIHVIAFPKQIRAHERGDISGFVDLSKQLGHLSKSLFVNYGNDKVLLLRIVGDVTN